jgi:3-hydroxyisobutyrate dehydrogenase-like beta-hydroxyacid dehydrogenase
MGLPMARRLLAAGHQVIFSSRRQHATDVLEAAGGRAVPTPLIVADECDLCLTCLPADDQLNEVYLGPEGVLEHLKPGTMIIDFSTTSPMIIQRIAAEASERQIRVVDAPVSGGIYGAERGILTIMVGCTPEALEEARPVLATLGDQIFHVGDVGMGKVFKIINNMLSGTMLVMVGEALSLAANAGADLELVNQVIASSSGSSRIWTDAAPKLIRSGSGPAGFRLELMRKDVRLAASLGEDLGTPTPLTSLALQFYTAACARGMGKGDATDIARLVSRFAGARLTAPDDEDEGEGEGEDGAGS